MIVQKLSRLILQQLPQQVRNIHVSVIGAANEVGSRVALKLKQNEKISRINLHDFDEDAATAVARNLYQLPGGPPVAVFGSDDLKSAVAMSHLIIMVCDTGTSRFRKDEIARCNAPALKLVCEAMALRNPDAILAISSSPVNSMVPFASAILHKYNAYNPFKVFGVANIDIARAKSCAAKELKANPRHLSLPVLGGRSEDTTVPLFSNLEPDFYHLDETNAAKLTRSLRQPSFYKKPKSLLTSWAVTESSEKVVDAMSGTDVELHCFAANPGFGTRFFAAPVTFGREGIKRAANNFKMNKLECSLLCDSVPVINADVAIGEGLAAEYNI
ncbi:lactate/malate dehydrogenase, NAD binding domain-containing protein [Phthorimaea operculella]|nr:lactate/malate dehydrogenase, NAD binding domain-containing protein [Phthorimaea operculella]